MGEAARVTGAKMRFRWLGVGGIEVEAEGRILLVDPYLTRTSLWRVLFGRLRTDHRLVSSIIQRCDHVLVTHAHFDHLMDVPEVVKRTGAVTFGSKNSCQILKLHGVPSELARKVSVGDRLALGTYRVEVLPSAHIGIPRFASGTLASGLRPPLKACDYRMDECFCFLITAEGTRLLIRPGETADGAAPADVLFVSPHRRREYYEELLGLVGPQVVVPIHWDDFLRPLSRPLRPILQPPVKGAAGLRPVDLEGFVRIVNRTAPDSRVLVPEILHSYDLTAALHYGEDH